MIATPDWCRVCRAYAELILYSDANEYDVETLIQISTAWAFMMQVEIESSSHIPRGEESRS